MIASSSSYNNSLLSCFCRYSFIKNSVTQSRRMLLIVVFAFSAPTLLKPADDGFWFCYRLPYIKHPLANHCEKTHQRLPSLVNSSVPYSIQSAHLSLSICLNGLLTWVSINWRYGVMLPSIVLHCVLWRLKESTAYSKCDLTESMIKRDLTCWKKHLGLFYHSSGPQWNFMKIFFMVPPFVPSITMPLGKVPFGTLVRFSR